MRIACQGSPHERRLIHESHLLKRRLRRLLRDAAGQYRGRDRELDILNYELGLDVIGLVAIQSLLDGRVVTLVTAPGAYFDPYKPERIATLERLAKARSNQGRRTLVVSKHEIIGKAPFDLVRTLQSTRSPDRRRSVQALVITGRRPTVQGCGDVLAPTSPPPFAWPDEERPAPPLAETDAA